MKALRRAFLRWRLSCVMGAYQADSNEFAELAERLTAYRKTITALRTQIAALSDNRYKPTVCQIGGRDA